MNACQAGRCAEIVDRVAIFCGRHFAMVNGHTMNELLAAYRPGRPPTRRYLAVLERARAEVRFAETAGYRLPRDGELPW